jgi:hypothetical protein
VKSKPNIAKTVAEHKITPHLNPSASATGVHRLHRFFAFDESPRPVFKYPQGAAKYERYCLRFAQGWIGEEHVGRSPRRAREQTFATLSADRL